MASTLKGTIEALAVRFADEVMNAIRGMSLQELIANTQGGASARRSGGAAPQSQPAAARRSRSGRLHRRSADEIEATVDRIVALLKRNRAGLRAEQIRSELGLLAKEMPRPIEAALASKKISKKGQKRATTYFATR